MKRVVAAFTLALEAGTASAGPTYTPLQGTYGQPFDNGVVQGVGFETAGAGAAGSGLGNLFDNVLTINGGAATLSCSHWFSCGQAFVDWVASQAQWGDDLHGISAGGQGPAVVTRLYYGYSNPVATTTHVIKLYDMVPPSVVPDDTATITKGALLTSIMLTGNPAGEYFVTVTGLSFQIPHSAAWIQFEETTRGGLPGTRWLSGGTGNGVGTSHPGVLYTVKTAPDPYDLWLPFLSFYFQTPGYVASNIQVALGGFHVPAPAAVGLLVVAGLVALRRRG